MLRNNCQIAMYIEYSKLQLFLFYDVMTVRVFALITLLVFSNFCTKAADKPESIVYAVQPTTYESMRHGEPSERIQQLAKNLNAKLVFYACPWARCLKAIEDGEADLIDDLYFTEERARVMHLITPAYNELELGFRFYSLPSIETKCVNTAIYMILLSERFEEMSILTVLIMMQGSTKWKQSTFLKVCPWCMPNVST